MSKKRLNKGSFNKSKTLDICKKKVLHHNLIDSFFYVGIALNKDDVHVISQRL